MSHRIDVITCFEHLISEVNLWVIPLESLNVEIHIFTTLKDCLIVNLESLCTGQTICRHQRVKSHKSIHRLNLLYE